MIFGGKKLQQRPAVNHQPDQVVMKKWNHAKEAELSGTEPRPVFIWPPPPKLRLHSGRSSGTVQRVGTRSPPTSSWCTPPLRHSSSRLDWMAADRWVGQKRSPADLKCRRRRSDGCLRSLRRKVLLCLPPNFKSESQVLSFLKSRRSNQPHSHHSNY